MKKTAAFLMAAILLIVTACAGAETAGLLDRLNGKIFWFSSGAGGWSTELSIGENGAFTGNYHDSEMGETGEGYPNGTLYGCSFHGLLSDPESLDEYSWKVNIQVEMDEGQVPEAIEDGIRYVTAEAFGVTRAKTVIIYEPGTPVDRLPEGFLPWSHLQETNPAAATLPYYAIWSEADESGFITDSEAVPGEPDAATLNRIDEGMNRVSGRIEDGAYVLTAQVKDPGEWRADELAQDDSVLKLASSGVENGVFTARYEPTGDGDMAVVLRHYNEHNTCDELHSFDLRVRNGKVEDVTGGSFTASPAEEDVDSFLSGKWLEKDTQFTVLNITKNPEGGWYLEFTSPVSHGAWVIRATAYHDCDYDAFVYADGAKYLLNSDGSIQDQASASGLWGTLRIEADPSGSLQLVWYDMMHSEGGETITFVSESALPE